MNLVPTDENGKSDPYFKISYLGRTKKSEIISDTLNPIYNQILIMENIPFVDKEEIENSDPIIIKFYDDD